MQLSEKDKYAISLVDNIAAWSYVVNSTVMFPKINDIIKLYYNKDYKGIFKIKSIEYNYNEVSLYKFYNPIWDDCHQFTVDIKWSFSNFLFNKESLNPTWA